jgi:hypothetical protein
MQKLAAYLVERHDGMNWPEARISEAAQLKAHVEEWLRSKGVKEMAASGSYAAEDGSHATFDIDEAGDGDRTWWLARLQEVTENGRRFVAAVSITNASEKVAVYAILEAGSAATLVNPVEVDPRCPKVIRTLLDYPGRWYHGFTELRRLQRLEGFEAGEGLAAEIKHPERTVPFIVVTEVGPELALPDLDRCLAYDLAGIANVVVLDSDATWALTDYLGAKLSCYAGAVRLYWPRFSINEDPYRHPLWTATRLRSATGDLAAIRERFRTQLRSVVMEASALSVVRPHEIDDIRSAVSRRVFAELKERASSLQDHAELAELYEKDNDQLLAINADLRSRVDDLQALVAKLEGDRAALLAHLRAAKVIPPAVGAEDIASDATIDSDEDLAEPAAGEVRFYKKKFAAAEHDIMARVNDCGHNKWQSAHAADKARKGIAKVEDGRTNWQTMQHCASCKGGGMWKVRW